MSRLPEQISPADMVGRVQVLGIDAQGAWRALPRSAVHLYAADPAALRSKVEARVSGAGRYMVAFAQ